jgi:hypothetical protein
MCAVEVKQGSVVPAVVAVRGHGWEPVLPAVVAALMTWVPQSSECLLKQPVCVSMRSAGALPGCILMMITF